MSLPARLVDRISATAGVCGPRSPNAACAGHEAVALGGQARDRQPPPQTRGREPKHPASIATPSWTCSSVAGLQLRFQKDGGSISRCCPRWPGSVGDCLLESYPGARPTPGGQSGRPSSAVPIQQCRVNWLSSGDPLPRPSASASVGTGPHHSGVCRRKTWGSGCLFPCPLAKRRLSCGVARGNSGQLEPAAVAGLAAGTASQAAGSSQRPRNSFAGS